MAKSGSQIFNPPTGGQRTTFLKLLLIPRVHTFALRHFIRLANPQKRSIPNHFRKAVVTYFLVLYIS